MMTAEEEAALRKNAYIAKLAVEIAQALAAKDYSLTATDLSQILGVHRQRLREVLRALEAAQVIDSSRVRQECEARYSVKRPRPRPQPQATP